MSVKLKIGSKIQPWDVIGVQVEGRMVPLQPRGGAVGVVLVYLDGDEPKTEDITATVEVSSDKVPEWLVGAIGKQALRAKTAPTEPVPEVSRPAPEPEPQA